MNAKDFNEVSELRRQCLEEMERTKRLATRIQKVLDYIQFVRDTHEIDVHAEITLHAIELQLLL